MPKVSVLMPVYNTREEYLRPAIESILNQTFSNFEFIIINDGSTDNSPQVVQEYADKDSRIKFINNKKNSGLIAVLNQGLELCTGEYIARMDSDDISRPERFAKQVAYMDLHPECGALGTWAQKFNSRGLLSVFKHIKNVKILDLLLYGSCVVHPSAMIRRSVLTAYGISYNHDYKHAEDLQLWVEIAKVSEIHNLQEILLNYRWHDSNISVVYSAQQVETTEKIRRNLLTSLLSKDGDIEKILNITKEDVKRFWLFGFLPIIRRKQYALTKTKYYLFDKIPLFKIQDGKIYLFEVIKIGVLK